MIKKLTDLGRISSNSQLAGQFVRWISGNRLLLYPDERSEFRLPARFSPSKKLQAERKTIKAARDHLSQIAQQNANRPARIPAVPVHESLRLGGAFGQSDITLGDIQLTAARAGQSREGLLDEGADRLEADADPDLADWYDLGRFDLWTDSRLLLAIKDLICLVHAASIRRSRTSGELVSTTRGRCSQQSSART